MLHICSRFSIRKIRMYKSDHLCYPKNCSQTKKKNKHIIVFSNSRINWIQYNFGTYDRIRRDPGTLWCIVSDIPLLYPVNTYSACGNFNGPNRLFFRLSIMITNKNDLESQ